MPRITISYRRDDSLDITGRIFDRLAAHFGRDAVFRDIDNIPPGADFRKHIDLVLDQSDIVLAIVGPRWIGPRTGQSRLASDTDPVRLEIETALRKDKPLIPVLVSHARMPRLEQLPETLRDFAYRNAVQADAGQDFDVHIDRLIRSIDRILGAEEREENNGRGTIVAAIVDTPDTDPGNTYPSSSAAAAEIEALRGANRTLEKQLAATIAARNAEAAKAALLSEKLTAAEVKFSQLSYEIERKEKTITKTSSALLREEEKTTTLTRQLREVRAALSRDRLS